MGADRAPIRAGIVGCDTSHVVAFTKALNDPNAQDTYQGVRITHAFPGGSPDIPASRDRLDQFTAQLRELGVDIVDSIEELSRECDAYFLESVDGRVHLDQFRLIAHGKPVFVDKPAASSLAELLQLFDVAQQTDTPVFSSSALRFCNEVRGLAAEEAIGELIGVSTTSPYKIEPHHPDLFWYGIHGMEAMHTLMGTGCQSVSRTETDSFGVVVGVWEGGRVGIFRGLKNGPSGSAAYRVEAFGTRGIASNQGFSGYEPLLVEICKFFRTGEAPVSQQQTIELFAAMEAADVSKDRGGEPVALTEILRKARHQVADEPR